MQVTQEKQCLKIECRVCNTHINRCLSSDALLQTLTDIMASHFSECGKVESGDNCIGPTSPQLLACNILPVDESFPSLPLIG